MLLSDHAIKEAIRTNRLFIDPLLSLNEQIRGAKIDLRLDNSFHMMDEAYVRSFDPLHNPPPEAQYTRISVSYGGEFILHPGNLVIGRTFESVSLPDNLYGRLDGRSSLARHGILVHATAPGIDAGFTGVIALELFNVGRVPVVLRPLMRIAALTLEQIDRAVEVPYRANSEARFGGMDTQTTWKPDKDVPRIQKAMEEI